MNNSSLPLRRLGRLLAVLRERARLTREDAANALDVNPQTIRRWENSYTVPKLNGPMMHALTALYDISDRDAKVLRSLLEVAESGRASWWKPFEGAISRDFDLFIELEDEASRVFSYQPMLPPGPLQTTDFRRSIASTTSPEEGWDIEEWLALSEARQTQLEHRPTEIIIAEPVLHHRVGGPEIQSAQLRHLTEVGRLDTVSLRIIPQSVGSHIGLTSGGFTILELPDPEPEVVYVECLTGDLFLETPEELRRFRDVWGSLDAVALSEDESVNFIDQVAREIE